MDKHYLTPLFSPDSIAVFAGKWDEPDTQTSQAQALLTVAAGAAFFGHPDLRRRSHHRHAGRPGADARRPRHHCAAARGCRGGARDSRSHQVPRRGGDLQRHQRHAGCRTQSRGTPPRHVPARSELPGFPASARRTQCQRGRNLATPGPLALVSQSGALTSSILDWASKNAVGFSTVVSLGPNTSVDIAQVLDFLASDPADPQHRRLSRRHLQRAPLHERAARGRQRQARGGAQGRAQEGRQPGGQDPFRHHRRQRRRVRRGACGAPVRCGCARSWRCFRRPSAWPRATGRSASVWPSSPTAVALACWRRTGSARSTCNSASFRPKTWPR